MEEVDQFIKYKREVTKTKLLNHLTESDCELIATNSREIWITDKQVILQQGQAVTSIYRIKYGTANIQRDGIDIGSIGVGWFIADSRLIEDEDGVVEAGTTFIADGPMVLLELDIPLVLQLFRLDAPLAMRFYRSLAVKAASLFLRVMGNVLLAMNCPVSGERPSMKKFLQHQQKHGPIDLFHSKSRRQKLRNSTKLQLKNYPLKTSHGTSHLKIKKDSLIVVTGTLGVKHKKTIPFKTVRSVCISSEDSVTIIFGESDSRTVFLKNPAEVDELFGYLSTISSVKNKNRFSGSFTSQSLSLSTSMVPLDQALKASTGSDMSSGGSHSPSSIRSSGSDSDSGAESTFFGDFAAEVVDKMNLKKGDIIMEQGNLYQRVWHLVDGTIDITKDGKLVSQINEGQIFGEVLLLLLRPCPVTMTVSSETATVISLPLYKLKQLTSSNARFAAIFYKRCAQQLLSKVKALSA